MRKQEKWTNKGNDKQKGTDSVLHKTRSQTQCLYILGLTVLRNL